MRTTQLVLILGLLTVPSLEAQTPADSAAIREAVIDYVDGWWTGDAERMARCLHPSLVKRRIFPHRDTGRSLMQSDTKNDLVEYTRAGGGSDRPDEKGEVNVSILALDGDIATVVASSDRYVDYIHLARWNSRWVIVNVLWAFRDS
jgi:hypothetical protein